jgi:hypothetical protein
MSPESGLISPDAAVDVPAAETAAELRAAIQAEDYEAAGRLMTVLTDALAARPATPIPGERQRVVVEAMDLLLWAKKSVLANRAHLQAKLNQVEQATRYKAARGAGRSRTWQMHG